MTGLLRLSSQLVLKSDGKGETLVYYFRHKKGGQRPPFLSLGQISVHHFPPERLAKPMRSI